jgi:hypothetical protein
MRWETGFVSHFLQRQGHPSIFRKYDQGSAFQPGLLGPLLISLCTHRKLEAYLDNFYGVENPMLFQLSSDSHLKNYFALSG